MMMSVVRAEMEMVPTLLSGVRELAHEESRCVVSPEMAIYCMACSRQAAVIRIGIK